MIYNCPNCLKKYTRKINYDYHVPMCRINTINLNKTQNETNEEGNDKLNLKEIQIIIKQLVAQNNKLEDRVKKLENANIKIIEINQRKINKLEFLNEKFKLQQLEFNYFITQIEFTRKDLEVIFNTGIFKGLNYLFNKLFVCDLSMKQPFIHFRQDKNLYIYNDKKWKISSDEDYHLIINTIIKKVIGEFLKWKMENHEKIINDDDMGILANQYQMKIFGNGKNIKQEYLPFEKKINIHINSVDFNELYKSVIN
jgi:hypothetical protein